MGKIGKLAATHCRIALIILFQSASGLEAEPGGKSVDIAKVVAGAAEVTVTVSDPVYKRPKPYAGYRLADLLRKAWPDVDRWAAEGALLIFRCADGYSPSMELSRALSGEGVVATRALDRPASDPWEPFPHGKETITPAPFYLVWGGVGARDANYPWPYQLLSFAVKSFDRRYGAAAPARNASAEARTGFRLFVQNCASCHSVNLVGGELGPENLTCLATSPSTGRQSIWQELSWHPKHTVRAQGCRALRISPTPSVRQYLPISRRCGIKKSAPWASAEIRGESTDGDDDVAAGGDLEAAAGADHEGELALLDDGRAVEGGPGHERVAVVDGGGAELAELGEVDGARALDRVGPRR